MSCSPAGLPPGGAIDRIKASGAKLTAFAPALALAKKLIRSGADALVIEGMEAGGHIGPVSTSVLAQEILPVVAKDIPVFVAGGIGRGEAIAAYLEMGAVGVQLGTRFVCATECIAHENFKKAFIRASARDAILSIQIDPRLPVIPVRALKNREMDNFAAKQREVAQLLDEGAIEMAEAQLQIEHYWAGALKRAVIDGDVESGTVMAGQSVGMVKREEPVAEIIQELVDEAAARARKPRLTPTALTARRHLIALAMPLTAAASAREILTGLHDVMARARQRPVQARPRRRPDRRGDGERGLLDLSAARQRARAVRDPRAAQGSGPRHPAARWARAWSARSPRKAASSTSPRPPSHPAFVYRPETGEERFHSFAGVPIVRLESPIGVLAVQHAEPRRYDDVEIEALQTVAMVLSEMIAGARLVDGARRGRLRSAGPLRLSGLKLVAGMAKGAGGVPPAARRSSSIPSPRTSRPSATRVYARLPQDARADRQHDPRGRVRHRRRASGDPRDLPHVRL